MTSVASPSSWPNEVSWGASAFISVNGTRLVFSPATRWWIRVPSAA